MNTTMKNYAITRNTIEDVENRLKEMIEAVKQSPEYQEMSQFLDIKKQELADLETVIRLATLDAFRLTGSKKPWEGVGIRETTRFVYDEKLSTKWALEKAQHCLTIDKKKFEKTISAFDANDLPEFIMVYKDAVATISKDLETYLVPEPQEEPAEVQA